LLVNVGRSLLRKRLADLTRWGSVVSVESLTKDLEVKKQQAKLIEAIETEAPSPA